jgi:predicted enzyme related to lactoylglutathione lyase
MKPRAVDFVTYAATELERTQAFYRDVLGLEVLHPPTEEGPFMEFAVGGTVIALTALPQVPLHPNALVALNVEDLSAAVEELRGKGVPIAMEPVETPVCFMAVVADPDGNKFLLHQRKDGTFG